MKTLEAISKLQEIFNEHGDIPLIVLVSGFGGHAEHSTREINFQEIYLNTDELFNEQDMSPKAIREFFPDWNEENEMNGDVKTVRIYCGEMISST